MIMRVYKTVLEHEMSKLNDMIKRVYPDSCPNDLIEYLASNSQIPRSELIYEAERRGLI